MWREELRRDAESATETAQQIIDQLAVELPIPVSPAPATRTSAADIRRPSVTATVPVKPNGERYSDRHARRLRTGK